MTNVVLALLCLLSFTIFIPPLYRHYSRKFSRKNRITTYRCPHTDDVEYYGGYRKGPVVRSKRCGYILRCSAEMHPRSGSWKAFCPEHDVILKKESDS